MADPRETGRPDLPEEPKPLSEAKLVQRYGELYADNLFYVWASRHRALTELELQKMAAIRRDLTDLTARNLPRIVSSEVTKVGIETIPQSPDLFITLLNGRLRIPINIGAVEQTLPQLRDMLSGR